MPLKLLVLQVLHHQITDLHELDYGLKKANTLTSQPSYHSLKISSN